MSLPGRLEEIDVLELLVGQLDLGLVLEDVADGGLEVLVGEGRGGAGGGGPGGDGEQDDRRRDRRRRVGRVVSWWDSPAVGRSNPRGRGPAPAEFRSTGDRAGRGPAA